MEPKPSQNLIQNASEIDLMLRTLKSESEQTLPHFCSFLPLQAPRQCSENRLRNSFPLRCFTKSYKNRIFSNFHLSSPPNWLQHGLPKLDQNRPKIFKICHKSVKTQMTFQNNPQTPKNLQKSVTNFQNSTYMASSHEDMGLCNSAHMLLPKPSSNPHNAH